VGLGVSDVTRSAGEFAGRGANARDEPGCGVGSVMALIPIRGEPGPAVPSATPLRDGHRHALNPHQPAVQDWVTGGVAAATIGVLVRRHADQERARRSSPPASRWRSSDPTRSRAPAVVVTTMHRDKGMEFSGVVVFGAEAEVVPLKCLVDQVPEADQPIVLGRERSLLYVACSRARDELVITWSGAPSPFLSVTR
jgi:UvrD-like helicase C-terminal domain